MGGHIVKRSLGLALVVLMNVAKADEPSLLELSLTPMAIEVNGVGLTAKADPYFNAMPRIYVPGERERATCESEGAFIVPIRIVQSSDDEAVRKSIGADRVWVVQGETVWRGSIKPGDFREYRSYGKMVREFYSRGCGTGMKADGDGPGVAIGASTDESRRAYTVIRLHVGPRTLMLRSPVSAIGSAS
jgi:hypothetical protein